VAAAAGWARVTVMPQLARDASSSV
jgi:hypothetical protein